MMWFIGLAFAAEEGEVCTTYGGAESPVAIVSETLPDVESSGLTASRVDPGLFYTHDDADGEPRLYLFREGGEYVGAQTITGAGSVDWEDMGAGPCPPSVDAESCLWIADIGDNEEVRTEIALYVVPESEDASIPAAACPLVYPNGRSRNAEAMLVFPDGTIRIATKDKDGAKIFRVTDPPCDGGAAQTLIEEAEVPAAVSVTGGAVNADGTAVVLRNLTDAWLWTGCVVDWSAQPVPVDLGEQPQGEAVAFAPDGALLSTSEVLEGEPLRYWRTPCETTEALTCPTCGCDGAEAGLLLLPLMGLVRRRRG